MYCHQTPSTTQRLWVPDLVQSHQKTVPLAQVALEQLQRRHDSIPGDPFSNLTPLWMIGLVRPSVKSEGSRIAYSHAYVDIYSYPT